MVNVRFIYTFMFISYRYGQRIFHNYYNYILTF